MSNINTLVSAVLLPEAKEKIAGTIGISYNKTFLHHVTLGFKPSEDEFRLITKNGQIEEDTLIVIKCKSAISSDDWGVQAVTVSLFLENGDEVYSTNAHPHITISTDGAPPKKSNDMLAQFAIGNSGDFKVEPMNIDVMSKFHIGFN